jgi:hypothetical protein
MSSAIEPKRRRRLIPQLRWPSWMQEMSGRSHVLVMTVLFVGALFAGWSLLPGISEKVAALEKDGQFRLALRMLEQQYDQGDRSQRTLFQLQHFYEQFGDLAGARRVLEELVELRPRDINLNRQLTALYRQTQDEAAYVDALKTGLQLRYSEAACRELIGIERRDGRGENELQQIQDCQKLGYDGTDDLIRAAHLDAADGRLENAVARLRSLDDKRRLQRPREFLTLFSLLLETNEPRDAYRRGLRWFRSTGDESLALSLIDFMADDDRHDLAIEFAKSVGTPGDGISLAIPELMLDRGQIQSARTLLSLWLERARLDQSPLGSRFVDAALASQDLDLAFTGAQRFGLQRLPQGDLVNLAEALASGQRQADFDSVRAHIGPEFAEANPLLGAAVALTGGDAAMAKDLLAKVDTRDIDEWRLSLHAQLNRKLGIAEPVAPVQDLPRPQVDAVPAPKDGATTAATLPKAPPIVRPTRLLRSIKRPRRRRFPAARTYGVEKAQDP